MIAHALLLGALLTSVPGPVSDGRLQMGTVLELTLGPPADPQLLDALFAYVHELDTMLTRFDVASDLSALNRAAGRGPHPVPRPLLELLEQAQRYTRLTRGSFDVTVGPLIELWSRAGIRGQTPSKDELERTLAIVGAEKIRIDPRAGTVELPQPGMSVDLGGIAKGFALDRLVERLRSRGVRSALLSFGGSSLHALGAPEGKEGWRVLLRDASDGFAGVLTLRDRALSVSESLGARFEIAGRRYGHILDPRTGRPLRTRRLAAVVAPSGALAEALSKAVLILDPPAALALLESLESTEGMLLDPTGPTWQTPGWPWPGR
ncbi:MAG: FAD:protein FMN transferase [Myxococcota bacterium]